jgi:ribose/xylose/arabinose/galactoside ABC-type transport system permease subunit
MMLFALDNLIWPILLVAFIMFSILLPEIFTQYRNIEFLLYTSAGLGAITLAEAICLISGNFDLSVGSIAGFSSMFTALILTSWFPAIPGAAGILIILAVGGAIGFLSWFFIAKFDVNPFLQTLSALIVFEGGILVLSTRSVYELPESYLWLGGEDISFGGLFPQSIPVAVLFMLGLFITVWFVLTKTRFGRAIYAVGGDE